MTKVTYNAAEHVLTMDGHAGAAPMGQDLVCAALSMLMFTLEASVQDHAQALMPTIYKADGKFMVRCSPTDRNRRMCRTILQTIFRGCELLSADYPEQVQTIRQEG